MIEIYSRPIELYGKLLLWLQSDFDYAAFYRWYAREYPEDYKRERWQAWLMLLNPVNWVKAIVGRIREHPHDCH